MEISSTAVESECSAAQVQKRVGDAVRQPETPVKRRKPSSPRRIDVNDCAGAWKATPATRGGERRRRNRTGPKLREGPAGWELKREVRAQCNAPAPELTPTGRLTGETEDEHAHSEEPAHSLFTGGSAGEVLHGGDLGRVSDLAHDLDDVPVRVEDA
jgi:hypothetical protein